MLKNIHINDKFIVKGRDREVVITIKRKVDANQFEVETIKTREEINLGKAEIWTCINGVKVESFEIEIISLKRQSKSDIKGICFRVTDEECHNLVTYTNNNFDENVWILGNEYPKLYKLETIDLA